MAGFEPRINTIVKNKDMTHWIPPLLNISLDAREKSFIEKSTNLP
jgi:hypothetical protein